MSDPERVIAATFALPDEALALLGEVGAVVGPDGWRDALGRAEALVSLLDGTDVGALGWWAGHPEPDVALLGMIVVLPAHRGGGVAREALAALEGRLAEGGIRRLRTAFARRRRAIHPVVRALGFEEMSIREHTKLGIAGASVSLWEKEIGA